MTATFEQTQNELARLLDIVSTGEEIVITRAGHPIAKITGLLPQTSQTFTRDKAAWIAELRQLRELSSNGVAGPTTEEIFEDLRADRF